MKKKSSYPEAKAPSGTNSLNMGLIKEVWEKGAQNLKANQMADGSFAYFSGHEPSIEATAWSAIALRNDTAVRNKVVDFLVRNQNSDGGWSTAPQIGHSDWTTALALLTLRVLAEAEAKEKSNSAAGTANGGNQSANALKVPAFQKQYLSGAHFLLDNRTELMTNLGKVVYMVFQGPKALDYPRGWPWTAGTFNWIEPTSYALMALKPCLDRKATAGSAGDFTKAVNLADTYMFKRACVGGGWNYGENIRGAGTPTEEKLPSFHVSTAQALCALQDKQTDSEVKSGLSHLASFDRQHQTVMALSWAVLARDCLGENVDQQVALLVQKAVFSKDNLFLLSLALCALDTKLAGNALKFPEQGVFSLG